jgi:hypothetical protein
MMPGLDRNAETSCQHFHLQKTSFFSIGQSRSALALSVPGTKILAYLFPVFLAPYRLTMLVVTGAVCRYHA